MIEGVGLLKWTGKPLLCLLLLISWTQLSAVEAVDDTGNRTILEKPAQRIISLAPHITEALFAAGAGDRVVGVVSYSDFPPRAKEIPLVGGYHKIDLERVLALNPDLVVAWKSGNGDRLINSLHKLGLKVYVTEPKSIRSIADTIASLGQLAGSGDKAEAKADELRNRWNGLKQKYSSKPKLRLFYQIWNSPMMTINGEHLISRVIELCGGSNIFSDLPALTPTVSVEAVIASDPDVILTGGMGGEQPKWFEQWRRWSDLKAVKGNGLFHINPDLLQRSGPRIIEGAELLCGFLDQARERQL